MKNIIYSIIIPFLLLVTVQICLKYPMTRDMFTDIEAYEGIDFDIPESNKHIKLETELINGNPSEDITIIYNSVTVSQFDMQRVCFDIDCDGVLQINNTSQDVISLDINYNPDLITVDIVNTDIPKGIHTVCTVRIR